MILSRYFPKADYGTYKQVLYVYNTLLTVFTLGLPKTFSYFLPRVHEDQAKSLIKKLTNTLFLLGGVFSAVLFFGSDLIAKILKNPDLALALKIFSPVPFLMLPTMGLEGILSTYRMTKFMAIYTVITRTGMLLCVALPVMLFGGNYIQAIIGFVIASFISFALALYLKYYPIKNNGNDPVETSYKQIFQFSLPLLNASLWGMLIHSADQFFISRYFGPKVFAEFANGVTDLPFVGMIIGATASVLSPVFARMSHENLSPQKEIYPIWKSVFEKSAMLIYPLLIYTWMFADVMMVFLYGEQYRVSSNYFRIKSINYFFDIIIYAPLIINIGKVKYYANVHMYGAIFLLIFEYLSIIIIKSPYVLLGISVICQLGRIYFLLRLVAKFFDLKTYQLFPLDLIGRILFPSAFFLLLLRFLLITILHIDGLLVIIISFPLYIFTFYLYSIVIRMDYFSIIKPLLINTNFKFKKH